jgi:hypothetical protein
MPGTVAVYFVASPLQYLAARRIAERFEHGARQVLLWYKPAVGAVVRSQEWDAAEYLPWPRFEPLPGPFGRHRRLRANLRRVAQLAGECDVLHLHSAVYDTEAINYFLRGLPRLCRAHTLRARILPDGIISIRRYPLSPFKRALQVPRKLRRLFAPELDYWCFGGDRIGSDAPFCDRIYALPGLPHEYPREKVVELPPLVERTAHAAQPGGARRALVIGQPLVGFGLMGEADMQAVSVQIRQWLEGHGFAYVDYKGHPKDPRRELSQPGYHPIELEEALETYMSHTAYDAVVGVRSSALLFARQVYAKDTSVVAFGWDRVRFKSDAERADMRKAFADCGVELV